MPAPLNRNLFRDEQLSNQKHDFIVKSPVSLPKIKLQKVGIMVREQNSEEWYINGMPALSQADPALDVPLDKLLATIPKDQFPTHVDAGGKTVPIPIAQFREDLKRFGCYDTSLVTVMIAALANRGQDLANKLIKRTKSFDEVKPEGGVSKAISQLAWHYYQMTLYAGNAIVNGKRVQPHSLPEVVADLGQAEMVSDCDPYTYGNCEDAELKNGDAFSFRYFMPKASNLTNDVIINLMKTGTVPMLGYWRHIPFRVSKITIGQPLDKFEIGFKDADSPHKIVFCGYQSGKYPLRIIDVGAGTYHKVRISSDLKELNFNLSFHKPNDTSFNSNFLNKPFLIYENDDIVTTEEQAMARRILFIDFYEGLKIRHTLKIGLPPK